MSAVVSVNFTLNACGTPGVLANDGTTNETGDAALTFTF